MIQIYWAFPGDEAAEDEAPDYPGGSQVGVEVDHVGLKAVHLRHAGQEEDRAGETCGSQYVGDREHPQSEALEAGEVYQRGFLLTNNFMMISQ